MWITRGAPAFGGLGSSAAAEDESGPIDLYELYYSDLSSKCGLSTWHV